MMSTLERNPIENQPLDDAAPRETHEESYSQILNSSSIIGGAQMINMLVGLVRVKMVAILIGPSGVGLIAFFQQILGIATLLSGFGLQSSGVRDVAEAIGHGDPARVNRTITSLRILCWLTGGLGMLVVVLLAEQISIFTFNSDRHTRDIQWLGVTVLLASIAGGQSAIIQGTRRIGDIARIGIISSIAGTIVSTGFYFWMGIEGVVPSLLALSVIALAVSTYYARRVAIAYRPVAWNEALAQARSLVSMGLAFVLSGLLATGIAFLSNKWIAQEFGLQAVGIYSAAFTLSAMFVQFILGAMGADYFPRLTAVAHDKPRMNQLINQQTEIGLLLAFPGLLATLALAPWVIQIFYTAQFAEAGILLKWLVLGCMGRVVAWPMSFSMLALGRGVLFAVTETLFGMLHLIAIWVGLQWLGLTGVAIAFAGIYAAYTLGMFAITHQLSGFYWNRQVTAIVLWMAPTAIIVFVATLALPTLAASLIGMGIALVSAAVCLRLLVNRLGPGHRISRTALALPFGHWLVSSPAK